MNLSFLLYDIRRNLREISGFIFGIGLPAGLYVMFGVIPEYANERLDQWHGNVSAITMASMALYGAMTLGGTTSAQAAYEYVRGWGRQLRTTPLSSAQYVVTKTAGVQLLAALPVVGVLLTGVFTNAEIEGWRWAATAVLAWLTVLPVNIMGLALGLLLRSAAAQRVVAAILVAFGFLGNLFMPLSGIMLEIAKFTPLYAANVLTRYPISAGWTIDDMGTTVSHEPLWAALVNFALWTLAMLGLAVYAARRPQER